RGDVHADDRDVLARGVRERRRDRGAVHRVDHERTDALVDERSDLRRLLGGVAVGRDRPDELHPVLRGGGLLEGDVRAPEVRAVAGERYADRDGASLRRVPLAGRERGRREHAGEPDERERAEQAILHVLLLVIEKVLTLGLVAPAATSPARPETRT